MTQVLCRWCKEPVDKPALKGEYCSLQCVEYDKAAKADAAAAARKAPAKGK